MCTNRSIFLERSDPFLSKTCLCPFLSKTCYHTRSSIRSTSTDTNIVNMTRFRNLHSKALLSDEWFTALVASMKNASNKTRKPQPTTLTRDVQNQKGTPLGKLVLAAAGPLRADRPGNGGMRLWQYSSLETADAEALNLAVGMEVKHTTFNTGFTGAKLVCAAASPVSEWSSGDKQQLLDTAASMLTDLDGAMYTGCDMNTTTQDMDYLSERCPYVLAAVGNPECCPNTATAYGVVGSVEAVLDGSVAGKTLLVHGCGNVGATVAEKLLSLGAKRVYTVDAVAERAEQPGCTALGADAAWWTMEVDALVPCSASGLLTESRAAEIRAGAIVGATNLPFASDEARRIAEQERGVVFVPEGVSSAGAVVVDSIEFFSNNTFSKSQPKLLYEFTREVVGEKVKDLLEQAQRLRVAPSLVVPLIAEHDETPVGAHFTEWCKTATIAGAQGPQAASVSADQPLAAPAARDGDTSILPRHRFLPEMRVDMARRFMAVQASRVVQQPAASFSAKSAARTFSASSSAGGSKSDVIIVGGGIMGLNIAYQLRRRAPDVSVTLLEQAPSIGNGSSGYSTGFQRAFYSKDETMKFALEGMAAYREWNDYLGDGAANARFTETGALWMLGHTTDAAVAMTERLAKFGVSSEVLDEAGLARKFPLINTEPFPHFDENGDEVEQSLGALAAVYEHGCGHVDPTSTLEDLLRACRRDGVDIRFKQRVSRFVTSPTSGRVAGVEMADGSILEAGAVVNAAGPWFNKLNDTVNLKLSTEALPTRIQVGHKWIPDEFCSLPFVADGWGPSGIYFMPRAANNQLVFGSVAHRFESEIVDPDDYNTALDPDVKQDYLNCLHHRLPSLPTGGEIVGFSSMYTVNQDDVHPMIGETVPGLWACNGFSGHGFKLAPAVGSLVAQQITGLKTDRWETSIPQDFMGPYRQPLTMKAKTHFA